MFVRFGDHGTVRARVMSTPEEMAAGATAFDVYREALVFPAPRNGLVLTMERMTHPLDMVFVDEGGYIVALKEAKPGQVVQSPPWTAWAVELPPGFCRFARLRPGLPAQIVKAHSG